MTVFPFQTQSNPLFNGYRQLSKWSVLFGSRAPFWRFHPEGEEPSSQQGVTSLSVTKLLTMSNLRYLTDFSHSQKRIAV